jgi:hypothetical protein
MSSVLDVVARSECGPDGYPLDWEWCRMCEGGTKPFNLLAGRCPMCGGHGSLRAAALSLFSLGITYSPDWVVGMPEWRCGKCNHPMSEGTWEIHERWRDQANGYSNDEVIKYIEEAFAEGRSIKYVESTYKDAVHLSKCDGKCTHSAEHVRSHPEGSFKAFRETDTSMFGAIESGWIVESSWRQVDIHFKNGWQHDLRPENLTLLCLRCSFTNSKEA